MYAALWQTGCGAPMSTLARLGSKGAINEQTPVHVHLQIEIAARPEKIWMLLTDAPGWPKWNSDVTKVVCQKVLSQGEQFDWTTGGSTIHSKVVLFEPQRRLAWTGQVYTIKAVHVWNLQPEPNGRTVVGISESMDGPLIASIYPSSKLTEADTAWLSSLKKAAEQR